VFAELSAAKENQALHRRGVVSFQLVQLRLSIGLLDRSTTRQRVTRIPLKA
jgi:hypothetical protein